VIRMASTDPPEVPTNGRRVSKTITPPCGTRLGEQARISRPVLSPSG
jgi:hypothetical protein